MGKIGQAFASETRTVLLLDEIDKADTDFQDDMLDVLDQMEFDIIEIDKTVKAEHRPVIVITSNAKKDLSDPFLGRCNFHHIAFPDPKMMRQIVAVHFPDIDSNLMENAIATFYRLREIEAIEKKPATRELLNWIRALKTDPDFNPKHRAVYYARVLEIPTPTWQAYDAKFFKVKMPDDVMMKHQERAYTSPIWYTP